MSKLYIMVGIPGSGKSSFAELIADCRNAIIVSSDTIRAELLEGESDQQNNSLVFDILHQRVHRAIDYGIDVIVDATNINRRTRKPITKLAYDDTDIIFVVMNTPIDECIERNLNRDRVVPEDVIMRMHHNLMLPTEDEGGKVIMVNSSLDIDLIP